MSANKKHCCYKNCNNTKNTLFKFPDLQDSERYDIWIQNSGLSEDINRHERRFLCEKHFSKRYIANQARRKMLVHTAVPMKCDEIDTYSVSEIVEELVEVSSDEETSQPKIFIKQSPATTPDPPKILNKQANKASIKVDPDTKLTKKIATHRRRLGNSYEDIADDSEAFNEFMEIPTNQPINSQKTAESEVEAISQPAKKTKFYEEISQMSVFLKQSPAAMFHRPKILNKQAHKASIKVVPESKLTREVVMPKELAVSLNEIKSSYEDIADDSQAFNEFMEIPTDQTINSPKTAESEVEAISHPAKKVKFDEEIPQKSIFIKQSPAAMSHRPKILNKQAYKASIKVDPDSNFTRTAVISRELSFTFNKINSSYDDTASDSQAFNELMEIPTNQPINSQKTAESEVEAISQPAKKAKVYEEVSQKRIFIKQSPATTPERPKILNKQAYNASASIKDVPESKLTRDVVMPKELAVPHNEINSYHDDIADDSQAFTEFLEIPTDQPITSPKTESKVEAISQLAKGAKVDIVKPLTAKESKQTEFIFMGEMYVQMPKSKYLEEKKEYEERISAYKTLLKDLGSKIQDAFKEPQ